MGRPGCNKLRPLQKGLRVEWLAPAQEALTGRLHVYVGHTLLDQCIGFEDEHFELEHTANWFATIRRLDTLQREQERLAVLLRERAEHAVRIDLVADQRRDEAGRTTRQALHASNLAVLIRIVLLNDADVALTASDIDAAIVRIPDNLVRSFGSRESSNSCTQRGVFPG